MSKHSGPRSEETYLPHGRLMLRLALGVAASLIAWVFLVIEAIDFGGKAKDGQDAAWLFLFLATLGATACLLLTMVLGFRLHRLMKGEEPVATTKVPGGRRAAR